MDIHLIDVNHKDEKAYIEFQSESVNANVTFTISDLNVMEDLIKSVRAILGRRQKDNTYPCGER